jgi:hypothetical protein
MILSSKEAAYAAGIIDGEGSIQLTRIRKTRWPSPAVSVASTDFELVEWLRSRVGGSIVQKKVYSPNHSPSYEWKLTDRRALQFLKIVRPFLVSERKLARCDLLLGAYLACTPRNGRYSDAMATRKRELIELFSSLP